jgi:hypothetical protein
VVVSGSVPPLRGCTSPWALVMLSALAVARVSDILVVVVVLVLVFGEFGCGLVAGSVL